MARTSGDSRLWKQTPSTNMTKAQLLELANTKEARALYLHRKNSKYHMFTADPWCYWLTFDSIQWFNRTTKGCTGWSTGRTRRCPGNSSHGAVRHHNPHSKATWHLWPPWLQSRRKNGHWQKTLPSDSSEYPISLIYLFAHSTYRLSSVHLWTCQPLTRMRRGKFSLGMRSTRSLPLFVFTCSWHAQQLYWYLSRLRRSIQLWKISNTIGPQPRW